MLDLSIREWECFNCSAKYDRDENAAINILVVGGPPSYRGTALTEIQTGHGVRYTAVSNFMKYIYLWF
ncbi:MAG: zinc ribbon domain-containing protein [Microcoleaceae cyanobacterium]